MGAAGEAAGAAEGAAARRREWQADRRPRRWDPGRRRVPPGERRGMAGVMAGTGQGRGQPCYSMELSPEFVSDGLRRWAEVHSWADVRCIRDGRELTAGEAGVEI